MQMPSNWREFAIVVLLRIAGVVTLLALPTAFLPVPWMEQTHRFLGLGELPSGPIVTYMARSLSLLYAFLGAITIGLSFDVRRYWPLIQVWSIAHVLLGALLVLIDAWSGLPLYWTLGEGIPVAGYGAIVLALQVGGPSQWPNNTTA